ncbi:hypothetical protein A2U01_0008890, partial [Trifolium medium]|nr:hypothetical protein [Trifolium medium]
PTEPTQRPRCKKVGRVEYRRSPVCSDGHVLFTNMKLQNDNDVKIMFSIFSQYNMKGLIELDTTSVIFVQDICSSLIHPRTFDEIVACIVEPENDELVDLSDP